MDVNWWAEIVNGRV